MANESIVDSSSKDKDAEVVGKALLQLLLLTGIIFAFGFVLNKTGNIDYVGNNNSNNMEVGLPIGNISESTTFPQERFLSDKKWEKYVSSSSQSISGRLIEGTGSLGDTEIEMHCILSHEGQLIGRYRNQNGTTLDVNGYIDPTDRNLHIQLGHDTEKSLMILSPDADKSSDSEYCYIGHWGKNKKPTKLTFIFKD